MEKIIGMYNKKKSESGDLKKNLILSLRMIGEMERLHPFIDGNSRIAWIILNRELLRMGFPFTLVLTHLVFSYFSPEELFLEVVQDWKNFEDVVPKN